MSFLSSVMKGVGAGVMTGSWAGGLSAMATDSFWAGMGVGVTDNMTGGALTYGMANAWNGNYGYGGFYGGGYPMDYSGLNLYSNYGNYYGNNWNSWGSGYNGWGFGF